MMLGWLRSAKPSGVQWTARTARSSVRPEPISLPLRPSQPPAVRYRADARNCCGSISRIVLCVGATPALKGSNSGVDAKWERRPAPERSGAWRSAGLPSQFDIARSAEAVRPERIRHVVGLPPESGAEPPHCFLYLVHVRGTCAREVAMRAHA